MEKIEEIVRQPYNQWLESAKSTGRKVCGYWCSYVPEELIMAAGMTPVRIRGMGSEDSSSGDAWISSRLCTFTRRALSSALDGHYDFLDGLIGLNSCDQVRRATQVWMDRKAPAFAHFMAVPRTTREINYEAYREEVEQLKKQLENFTGNSVTDESLREAVELVNRKRRMLSAISALRKKAASGHIDGSEMLAVSVASSQLPAEDFLELAEELLSEREEKAPPEGNVRARLIVCGGELDEPDYMKVLEGQGARIVGEFVCFGSRAYSDPVGEEGDPMENICRRYFYHVPCVRMGEKFRERFDVLREMIDEYEADGLIFQRLKFCQLWGAENHNMLEECRRENIPVLSLEREYGVVSTGQVKTRTQAFLERIEARES